MKKTILIIAGTLAALIILLIVFISPLTKYILEKYDVKITGRELRMDWAYVNPFSGYIHLKDFRIYEKGSDTVFISTEDLSFRLNLKKLINGEPELTALTLSNPVARIVQFDKEHVNYQSLIDHFTADSTADEDTSATRFTLQDIEITDGVIYYIDPSVPVNYFVKKFNFKSSGYRWDIDSLNGKFSFESGPGKGAVDGEFVIHLGTSGYRFGVRMHEFDLKIFEQYLKDLSNYGSLSANMDADVVATGNFHDVQDITARGFIAINEFHFGKTPEQDYAAFDKLLIQITELSPVHEKYMFDSVVLTRPYFVYEQYDKLNNIETMFGDNGSNIDARKSQGHTFNLILEVADYISELAKNFVKSYYKVNRLAVYRGSLEYNDYSVSERFSVGLDPLNITANSIDKNNQRIGFALNSGVKPFGALDVSIHVNPKDFNDFELNYKLDHFAAATLNPYIISSTSYPLDRGTIDVKGNWNVKNKMIRSNNHVIVIDPRVGGKDHSKETGWLPMKIVMSLIRERGNVIDYQIPIEGSLKNPKFHIHDILLDVVRNLFVKPPTTPYRMEVRSIENKLEKSFAIRWDTRRSELPSKEERYVNRIAEFLTEHPEASVSVYPMKYEEKEKEYITLFEARKRYYLARHKMEESALSQTDLNRIEKLSTRDSGFVRYLNRHADPDKLMFTTQDKSAYVVGSGRINKEYAKLLKERESGFMEYFRAKGVADRVKMEKGENTVPYNGFTIYRIRYKGLRPEDVTKAYRELQELNNKPPRDEYKEERRKSKWWQFRRGRKQRDQ
jgi:hypothetical protein